MFKQKLIETVKKTPFFGWYRKNFYEAQERDYNQEIIDNAAANKFISERILSGEPLMVSRLGSSEVRIMKLFHHKKPYPQPFKDEVKRSSGIFPNDDAALNKFAELYYDNVKNVDVLGVWFNPFEDKVSNMVCPDAKLTKLKNLEPYFAEENPWSYALKGKKVLVINPPLETIVSQYEHNREKLFANSKVLPEFEIVPYKPVISFAGDSTYASWFDALEFMKGEISEIDFDIAIIGAGAYGLPLASHIKEIGKQAIHMGGATQMLFGVYGDRWTTIPDFDNIINEHWVKPSQAEKPKTAKDIDNSSYW